MTTQVPEGRTSSRRARRRATPRSAAPRFDSWRGVVWTVAIALDFFWLANPRVLVPPFDHSLWSAAVVTAVAAGVTVSRFQAPRPAESVLAVVTLGFASVLWSIDPDQSFSFTVKYAVIAAIGTIVARNVDARAAVHGLVLGGLTTLGASVYAITADLAGARGPVDYAPEFAGVGGNRNILSFTLVLAFSFGLSLLPRSRWARALWALAVATLLVGICLAESITGLIAATVLAVVAVGLLVSDRRRLSGGAADARRRRLAWIIGVAGAAVAVVAGLVIGKMLGRDIGTLSGRTVLWQAIWDNTTGADRWFGSGWGAVWRHQWAPANVNPKLQDILADVGFIQWHGHNSAFDLIPELGLLGVAVFATTYVQAIARSRRLRPPAGPVSGSALHASRATILGVVALLLIGLTEPMSTIPLGWFTVVVLATGLLPARARAHDGGERRAQTEAEPDHPEPSPDQDSAQDSAEPPTDAVRPTSPANRISS